MWEWMYNTKKQTTISGKWHCITKSQLNIWCDIYLAVHKHAGTLELLQGTHLSKPIFRIIRNNFARWCIIMQSHRSKIKLIWLTGRLICMATHIWNNFFCSEFKGYCTINNSFHHNHHKTNRTLHFQATCCGIV